MAARSCVNTYYAIIHNTHKYKYLRRGASENDKNSNAHITDYDTRTHLQRLCTGMCAHARAAGVRTISIGKLDGFHVYAFRNFFFCHVAYAFVKCKNANA